MEQGQHRTNTLPLLVFWMLLYAASVIVSPFAPAAAAADRSWKGYNLLLLRSMSRGDVLERLSAGGYEGVISPDTARIAFTTVTGTETIPISRIPQRFEPFDPRFDPYMRNTGAFFRAGDGGAWEVLYVPDRSGPFRFSLHMKKLLAGLPGEWSVAGGRTEYGPLAAAGFALLVLAVLLRASGGRRLLLALGALPWISTALAGGPGPLLGSAALYFAWAEWGEGFFPWYRQCLYYGSGDSRGYRLASRSGALAAALLLSVVFAVWPWRGFGTAVPFLAGLAGTASLSVVYLHLLQRGSQRRLHRPFLPVPILRDGSLAFSRSGSLVFRTLLVILLTVSPLSMVATAGRDLPAVPRPIPYGDIADFSRDSLERLWLRHAEHSLPDLSDYLVHAAYQQGFLYGREYRFPEKNEELMLSRYVREGVRIVQSREAVIRFSDAWVDDVLKSIDKRSVEYLLYRQDRPMGVAYGAAQVPVTREQYLKHLLLCIVSFGPTILAGLRISPPTRYGMRNPIPRRKRQEA